MPHDRMTLRIFSNNLSHMIIKDRIKIEVINHVAQVTLIRSDKMNALDQDMFDALIEGAEVINADGNIRCVVLAGEGKAFCAGLDLSNFKMPTGSDGSVTERPLADRTHGIANHPQKAAWAWRELPIPVIAAVHGVAFGGGLQIMLGSDIRYIHPETRLSIMEIRWGLVPDMSSTQVMRHIVRDDIIRELTYTGRIFSGSEAVDYGFATHLSENPLADALKLAEVIASKSPSAIQGSKSLLHQAPYLSDADGLLLESHIQDEIIGKKNQMEAVFSEMQKRTGNYDNAR